MLHKILAHSSVKVYRWKQRNASYSNQVWRFSIKAQSSITNAGKKKKFQELLGPWETFCIINGIFADRGKP